MDEPARFVGVAEFIHGGIDHAVGVADDAEAPAHLCDISHVFEPPEQAQRRASCGRKRAVLLMKRQRTGIALMAAPTARFALMFRRAWTFAPRAPI
jgi:hypothetical protein